MARTKLNSKKSLERFLPLPSIFGRLNRTYIGQARALCYNFDFKLTSDAKIEPARKTVAFHFAHHDHALVTLYV